MKDGSWETSLIRFSGLEDSSIPARIKEEISKLPDNADSVQVIPLAFTLTHQGSVLRSALIVYFLHEEGGISFAETDPPHTIP